MYIVTVSSSFVFAFGFTGSSILPFINTLLGLSFPNTLSGLSFPNTLSGLFLVMIYILPLRWFHQNIHNCSYIEQHTEHQLPCKILRTQSCHLYLVWEELFSLQLFLQQHQIYHEFEFHCSTYLLHGLTCIVPRVRGLHTIFVMST